MLRHFPSFNKPTPIDVEIDATLKEMRRIGVNDENYPKLLTYLERLNEQQAKVRKPRVSRDTMALVLGGLAEIIVIVAYEQKHVITTKALSRRNRPK